MEILHINSKVACVTAGKDFKGTEEEVKKIATAIGQFDNVKSYRVEGDKVIFAFDEEIESTDKDSTPPSWASEIDLSNLAFGTYWWASDWHSGQASAGYEALSRLSKIVKPGAGQSGVEPETVEHYVYDNISSEDEALAIAKYVEQNIDSYLAKADGETPESSPKEHFES